MKKGVIPYRYPASRLDEAQASLYGKWVGEPRKHHLKGYTKQDN
jgi:hypothetical protein